MKNLEVKKLIVLLFVFLSSISLFSCQKMNYKYNKDSIISTMTDYFTVSKANGTAKDLFIPNKENDTILSMAYETSSYFVAPVNIKDTKNLYYKKPYKRFPMASLTKLMTALVILENEKDLSKMYYVSSDAVDIDDDNSTAELQQGDSVSIKDLLYALLIPSGNDAANVLAENFDESIDNFLILMNNEAERIGCLNTHFSNPCGLDNEYHFTSAYDLYIIVKHLLKYPIFTEITKLKEYSTKILQSDGTYRDVTWENTNYFLIGDYILNDKAIYLASKTGTTTNAGYCMTIITKSKTTNEDFISIVLHATSRPRLYSIINTIVNKTH